MDEEKSERTPEIGEKITEILRKNERRITTRELTTRLTISKGSLHALLTENGIRKLCSRFVPRYLTAEMRACRMKYSQENLEIFERVGERLLQKIL